MDIYMCIYMYMYVYGMQALVDGMRALGKVMRVHTSMECVRAYVQTAVECVYICMYIYSYGMRA